MGNISLKDNTVNINGQIIDIDDIELYEVEYIEANCGGTLRISDCEDYLLYLSDDLQRDKIEVIPLKKVSTFKGLLKLILREFDGETIDDFKVFL